MHKGGGVCGKLVRVHELAIGVLCRGQSVASPVHCVVGCEPLQPGILSGIIVRIDSSVFSGSVREYTG